MFRARTATFDVFVVMPISENDLAQLQVSASETFPVESASDDGIWPDSVSPEFPLAVVVVLFASV